MNYHGEEFDPAAIKLRPTLRINTLKATHKEVLSRMSLEKVPFLKDGYYYEVRGSVGATPEHLLGLIYVQEAASQLCAEVLEPKPGEKVLDMCAAPGSKTTHLAMLMRNEGVIVALDANNPRLPALKNNLERCGVANTVVYKKDARYADDLGIVFDKVLLDAPCSGNFTQEEGWFDKPRDIAKMTKMQKALLESGLAVLKSGGRLLYSTCSLEPQENELVIDWLLTKYPDITLESIDTIGDPGITEFEGRSLNPQIAKCRRLWPHKTGTQGFFLALLVKS